jgi:hypothetical protein
VEEGGRRRERGLSFSLKKYECGGALLVVALKVRGRRRGGLSFSLKKERGGALLIAKKVVPTEKGSTTTRGATLA